MAAARGRALLLRPGPSGARSRGSLSSGASCTTTSSAPSSSGSSGSTAERADRAHLKIDPVLTGARSRPPADLLRMVGELSSGGGTLLRAARRRSRPGGRRHRGALPAALRRRRLPEHRCPAPSRRRQARRAERPFGTGQVPTGDKDPSACAARARRDPHPAERRPSHRCATTCATSAQSFIYERRGLFPGSGLFRERGRGRSRSAGTPRSAPRQLEAVRAFALAGSRKPRRREQAHRNILSSGARIRHGTSVLPERKALPTPSRLRAGREGTATSATSASGARRPEAPVDAFSTKSWMDETQSAR